MTYDRKTRMHSADDGKMFVRRSSGKVLGYRIQLGANDSIDSYEERTFTEEEVSAFWKSMGRDDPRKPMKTRKPNGPREISGRTGTDKEAR